MKSFVVKFASISIIFLALSSCAAKKINLISFEDKIAKHEIEIMINDKRVCGAVYFETHNKFFALTANHCVMSMSDVVFSYDDKTYYGKTVSARLTDDIAIVQIEKKVDGVVPVRFAKSKAKNKSMVFAFDRNNDFVSGYMMDNQHKIGYYSCCKVSFYVTKGASGCGVYNVEGEIIGLITHNDIDERILIRDRNSYCSRYENMMNFINSYIDGLEM